MFTDNLGILGLPKIAIGRQRSAFSNQLAAKDGFLFADGRQLKTVSYGAGNFKNLCQFDFRHLSAF
jgi:hypothetical protein